VWRVQFQQVEQLSMDSENGQGIQATRRTLQALRRFASGKTGGSLLNFKPRIPRMDTDKSGIPSLTCNPWL
jgi:hypothetical protein